MLSRAQILDLIDDIYARRVDGDKAEFAKIWADGATYQMAGTPETLGEAMTQRTDARQMVGELIDQFNFHAVELIDSVVEGNRAAIMMSIRVSTANGPTYDTRVFNLWEFDDDGKALSLIEFADTALVATMAAA